MTTGTLHGKTVAILVTDGFEQSDLMEPRKALHEAGATTQVVSPAGPKVKGWNHKEWGKREARTRIPPPNRPAQVTSGTISDAWFGRRGHI